MLFSSILLPLALVGAAYGSPLEKRAAITTGTCAAYKSSLAAVGTSANAYCQSYIHLPTTTLTKTATVTKTSNVKKTVSKTVTATKVTTTTVKVTATSVAKRDLEERAATTTTSKKTSSTTKKASTTTKKTSTTTKKATTTTSKKTSTTTKKATTTTKKSTSQYAKPTALKNITKATSMSSLCSCLNVAKPSTTVTKTATTVKTVTTGTTTITKAVTATSKVTKTTTVTPSASKTASFYLQASNGAIAGQYAYVSDETLAFTSAKASAGVFALDSSSHLVASTGIANMQSGASSSSLFFNNEGLIQSLKLVEATCKTTSNVLTCTDQTATTFFYCSFFGESVLLAPSTYTGEGCSKVTLKVVAK